MTPVLAFDIETVPDTAGLRRLHDLDAGLSDHDVAQFAFARRRIQTGSDFLPPHLHRVVAISCALREGENFRVWSLGTTADSEADLIRRFYDGIERYTPQIVSWNGSGFDLPVLHYRTLLHGLSAPRYWDMGEDDREFKWNNYISRYHQRHLDLMDLLAMYTGRANAPLDALAQLMGFPGKLGMDGSAVWGAFQDGRLEDIWRYCETDVVNTYLVYLRFQQMRGAVTPAQHGQQVAAVRAALGKLDQPHWQEFLSRWTA